MTRTGDDISVPTGVTRNIGTTVSFNYCFKISDTPCLSRNNVQSRNITFAVFFSLSLCMGAFQCADRLPISMQLGPNIDELLSTTVDTTCSNCVKLCSILRWKKYSLES